MICLFNRKQFIKNIPYEELPPVCILQILRCHGKDADEAKFLSSEKYRRKCYQHVMDGEDLVIQLGKKKDVGRMIRYINPFGEFGDIELVKHLAVQIQKPETLLSGFTNYNVGFPTEQNPTSLPMDVLLWIAHYRGLLIEPTYNEQDIYRMITLSNLSPEILQTRLLIRFINMNPQEIIRKYGHELLPSGQEEFPSFHAIRQFPTFPRFAAEAVAMAAGKFGRDITMAESPMKEYENILMNKQTSDTCMLEAVRKDKLALDLKQRFRSYIPEHLYSTDSLKRMAEEEGYAQDCGLSHYDYLCSVKDHDTFYAFGKGPAESYPRSNEYLLIHGDRVDCLDRGELLTYGNIHKPNAQLVAISYQELLDTFKLYKEFRNPTSEGYQIFSERSIRKLKILAQKPCADAKVHEVRLGLYKTIVHIETFIKKRNLDMLNMKDELNVNLTIRSRMIVLFQALLDIAKAARSYSATGQDPFPYKVGSADEIQTEVNVSNMLIALQTLCQEEPIISERFLSLAMMRYNHATGTFHPSQEEYDGISIRDRLTILAKGDSVNEMSSCIRLTSNWLCHTAYYYLVMLGEEPPFEMTALHRLG